MDAHDTLSAPCPSTMPSMARPPTTRKAPSPAIPRRTPKVAADTDTAPVGRDISPSQRRYLRSLAHDLKPVILVGAKGVTPALLAELYLALEHHELVKLKIAAGDRDERDAWVEAIVKTTGVALVQRVGNIATLFRARKKNPGIVLPR
jgi:RNA-binding protein